MPSIRFNRITLAAVVALATLASQVGHAASTVSRAALPAPTTVVNADALATEPDTLIQSQGPNLGTWSIGQIEIPLRATNGTGPYEWSVIGDLPLGMALRTDVPSSSNFSGASAGLIGVATAPGPHSFTLRVTSGSETADQVSTLTITSLRFKDSQQLPDAFVGTEYTHTLTALGGNGSTAWTNTDPSFPVPPGMTLTAAGVLSGTPTIAGSNWISVGVTDGVDTVYRGVSLRVSAIEITTQGTTPGVLPNATQNVPYTASVAASPTGAYNFSANGLPFGLSMNDAGGISGTVNSSNGSSLGKFSVSVTASAGSVSYTKTMSIDVVGASPLLPNISPYGNALADCTIGLPCSPVVGVFSGGKAPFSWSASGHPAGMSLRTGDGVTSSWITPGDAELWGAPDVAGIFNVDLTVTDATGATATNTFPITVSPLLQTNSLPDGTRDTTYSQALRVIGGTTPYSAALTAGQLPAGLTLDPATLLVSGTPIENGYFSWVTTFTDFAGATLRTSTSLFISGGTSTISINNNGDLGSITVGSSFSNSLSNLNACCSGPYTWSMTGVTPPGLQLNFTTGQWGGTATTPGFYTFLVQASNGTNVGVRQFTLNVTPISISMNSTLPFGNVNAPYSQALAATGGTGTVTWTLNAGSYLPPGLTLAANGLLSGTPTWSGQYQFTVTAADTGGHTRTAFFSLSIYPVGGSPPVAISTNSDFGTFSIGQIETPLSATGGTGTYTWSLFAGSLPPGISIRTDPPSCCFQGATAGLIGIATTPNTYNFTLRVTSGGQTADLVSTLKVTALTAKENQLPDVFVGTFFSYPLTALGNAGSATWTLSPFGTLPAGLSLSTAGVLSGTPETASFSNINFNLTDGVDTVSKSVNLNVYAVRITTPGVLPNVTQGVTGYSATIAATGGTGSNTFTANGLPFGLNINWSSGVISGTVNSGGGSSLGKVSVSVTASNNGGSYTKTMSIDVLGAAPALPSIAPSSSLIYDCTLGVPCNRTISVQSGGTAPFTWEASGLPPGMSMRSGSGTTLSWVTPGDAELWGTATALGTYNVTLTVTGTGGATATNTFPMTVSPLLQTGFLPNGTRGTGYSQSLRVIGGRSAYNVALAQAGAQLPLGLTLNGLTLGGTPTENGSFNLDLLYTDADTRTLRVQSSFFINPSTVSINTNGDLGSITVGSSYSNTLNASGPGPITWSVTGGTPPPGLTLSSTTGQWSGAATTAGFYTFLVEARNSGTDFGVRQFTLNVTPLSISNTTLQFGNVGTAYNQTLTATGGTGTVTWTVPAGSYLPPGLTLASNGVLTGTPTASGQYRFTVIAADSGGNTRTAFFTVSIYPAGGGPPVAISTNSNFSTFSIGQVETALTATGGNGTYSWSHIGGTLPPGLSVRTDKPSFFQSSASAGLIGIATAPGNYGFTLQVTSGLETAAKAFTMNVTALTTTENQLPDVFVGTFFSYPLTALGHSGGATWTSTGSMPSGLSLSTAGVLSGTPQSAGNSNINFNLAYGGDTVSKGVSLNIYAVRITSPGVLPNATQDVGYNQTITATGGTGVYTFSANGLPNGLNIDQSSGVISGTVNSCCSSLGRTNVNVTATDSNNVSYNKSMSIDVVGAAATPPSLDPSNSNIYDCTLGVSCTRTISVRDGGTAPFTWQATNLPPGMSIRSGSGTTLSWVTPGDAELWGTATATGTYNVQVTVTDFLGASATNTFPMHVSELLQTNYLQQNGTLGTAYAQTMRVIGGTGPYTAVQTGGQLAAGLAINNPTPLRLAGTPLESGNFNPVFTYTDSASHTLQIDSYLYINGAGSGNVSINSNGDLGSVTAGTSYSNQLYACCVASYAWSHTGGTLPPGVTLSSGGLLSGPPTTAGLYTFLVRAADSSNSSDFGARQFTLTVTAATVPTITLSATTVSAGGTVTATVSNGPGTAGDWVGLYPTGGSAAQRVSYQFLNGFTSPPATGLTGATLSFTMAAPGTYELRFFRNNTLTLLATSAPFTVTAPTITPGATSVTVGSTVTATIANGPGTAGDWVGLYPVGGSAAQRVSYQFLNGLTSPPATGLTGATLSFTMAAPGTYELRFFRNNTSTLLATSAPITVTGPTITPGATSVTVGSTVTATIANGPGYAQDWVGLYPVGGSAAQRVSYQFLNGLTSPPATGVTGATLSFTMAAPGTYELRFFRNNTLILLATSAPIAVTAPTITPNATSVTTGSTVTATIANGPGNAQDWVGLYPVGGSAAQRVSYRFLNGLTSPPATGVTGATLTFTMPAAPGTYELRFFRNNTLTLLATSAPITVTVPTITPGATSVTPGGTVTATIANGPGNAQDWVGLYPVGGSAAQRVSYQFLNGFTSAPVTGVAGATLTFTMPAAPGTYELRFFRNNTMTLLATSAPITVAP